MKKVLILAYDFPPYNSIGGQRPYSWYKYFKEFGIEPIVVTRHWSNNIKNPIDYIKPSIEKEVTIEYFEYGTIIRSPFFPNIRDKILLRYGFNKFSILRKLLTLLYLIFEYVFPFFDNKKNIYKISKEYLRNNKIDYIIATGEPFILFKYASCLSKKYKTPWIADYRDGWSTNYNIDANNKIENFLKKILIRRYEIKYVSTSILIITVSKYLSEKINAFVSQKTIKIIMNGFDMVLNNENIEKNKLFTIAYAGTIYPHQRLEFFLDAVKEFQEKKKTNIRIIFYGLEFYAEQFQRAKKYANKKNIEIHTTKRLDKDIVHEELKKSDVLLLLANENIDGSCAKIYEYLALKKKILLCVNDNATLYNILTHTKSGFICNNTYEITKALETLFQEWEQTGKIECNSVNIEHYSRKEQTKKLADIIHSLN